MALNEVSTQLGCGRDVDQVWDHLDQAPDAHELTCPLCQGARSDLGGLASATRTMLDDERDNPELEPGPHVLERILSIARAEVRRGRRLPLDQPTGTQPTVSNTVSEQTVNAVIRRTGDLNRCVQIRRCTLTDTARTSAHAAPTRPPGDPVDSRAVVLPGGAAPRAADADAGPGSLAVALRVSVSRDLAIADASEQLRAAVIAAVAREVGMDVVRVDIEVEDLHDA